MAAYLGWLKYPAGMAAAAISLAIPALSWAQTASPGEPVTIVAADPAEQGSGATGPTVRRAKSHRALPIGPATKIGKDAADRAHARSSQADPEAASKRQAPVVVGGLNFAGMSAVAATSSTPPDNEGAIGTTRYIQTLNSRGVRIINRTTHATIASGTLNQLARVAATVDSFDPQIIWDATGNRFFYTMDSIFSVTDNRLSFGFSKSDSPANVTTDWCHYAVKYNTPFPDYPKLGDSQHFIIIGVNVFANNFNGGYSGSDIVAISKPAGTAAIVTCPAATSLKVRKKVDIRDSSNFQVFTPVPSNQIDDNATGYVVAVNGALPSTKLWFFNVTKSAAGIPLFGNARGLTVASYNLPPSATQANGRLLDTSDVRNTQAVQAINPDRGANVHSFWTQHTIANATVSGVRWYEVNPAPAVPVLLRSGIVKTTNVFNFNGAISPDRKKNGAAAAFGDSFVLQFNSASSTVSPEIRAVSSFNGAAVSASVLLKAGVGPYADFSCPFAGNICRWGDYAAATPDPAPTIAGRGVVWGTNQFSGVVSPLVTASNWRTQIFALQP